MRLTVYVANAFSKNRRGGNPAGVVLESGLTISQKMAIAKALGYAETAYISESSIADYRLEYFTPKEEVDLCGHATIASFVILMHLNQIVKDHYTIETKSGVLSITIQDDRIFMEQNSPIFSEEIDSKVLQNCFDLDSINEQYPIQVVSTGLRDLLVPIKSEPHLQKLEPHFAEIQKMSEKYQTVGMHLYTFNQERIICRNFAPLYDINEEAATGTSNAALACFLYEKLKLKRDLYIFEQGASLNSLSEILVKFTTDSYQNIEKVFVGGKGYFCETKVLDLQELS